MADVARRADGRRALKVLYTETAGRQAHGKVHKQYDRMT